MRILFIVLILIAANTLYAKNYMFYFGGGRSKVEIYSEKLPNQHVFDVIKTCDFAVLSGDAPGLVPQFNRWANKEKVPWINVGYINDIAVFGPMVIPDVTGCTHCQDLVAVAQNNNNNWSEVLNQINRHTQAPSIGPVNMLAASMASLDILKYLGEFGQIKSLNKRVGLWTHDFHIEEQDCSKNPNCRVCGHE